MRDGKFKNIHQTCTCLLSVITLADELNDFVNIHNGDEKSINQVQTFLSLSQTVLRTSLNYLLTVFDINCEHFAKAQSLWTTVDQGHVVDAERIFKWGVAIELFENCFGIKAGLDLNDEFQSVVTVCEIDDVRDSVELFTGNAIFNFVDDLFGTDKVRKFGDGDSHFARGDAANSYACSCFEAATSCFVCLTNTVQAHDDTTGRKVWARNKSHQVVKCRLRVSKQMNRGLNDLDEVVWSHVGSHTNGNTTRTVD